MKWLSILAALLGAATALRSDIPEHRLGIAMIFICTRILLIKYLLDKL
jgi:hypothetical protein